MTLDRIPEAGRLQVRQGSLSTLGDGRRYEVTWDRWQDVESMAWLVGFMVPHPDLIYGLRHAPEPPDPNFPF